MLLIQMQLNKNTLEKMKGNQVQSNPEAFKMEIQKV